jgi:cytochrome c5
MYKSYRKLLVSGILVSAALTAAFASDTGASKKYTEGKEKGKLVIDGGATYPVKNGMTGPYHVNVKAHKMAINNGRPATPNEIKAWNIDVMPDGTGLPEGHGTAEEGEAVYEAKCLSCHGDFGSGGGGYPSLAKGNAYELHETLKFQRTTPDADGPVRVFGTYWPRASTLWWYIKTGMPHPAPLSLTDDQVYALVAYIYTLNELKLQDGTEIEDDTEINKSNVLKVDLPNKDGFIPNIDGPHALEDVRAFYNDYSNYGNGTRCMKDCFKGKPKILPIQIEQKSFLPPLSEKRDLPENPCWIASCDVEAGGSSANAEGKKIYDAHCAVCHGNDSMGAPDLGNKEAWVKVMKQGMDTVLKNAINGKNAMPPRGGTDLPDEKIKAAIEYMYSKSK